MDFKRYNLSELLDRSAKRSLVLPNFQRDFVWKVEEQKLLLGSFLTKLPIGNFLILEGKKADFVCKELCYDRKVEPTESCVFLLDGQQRLSTLKGVFSDLFGFTDWSKNWGLVQPKLRQRWYLDLSEESCLSFLGYNDLRFKVLHEDKDGNKVLLPRLQLLEPSEILEGIKYHTIQRTKNLNSFFHPGFPFSSSSDFDKKIILAEQYATANLIPLFDFLSEDNAIVRNCINQLAQKKLTLLKNRADSDNSLFKTYLAHIDSDIEKKVRLGSHNEINSIWETLRERWTTDLMEYFKELFRAEVVIPVVESNELPRATSVFEYMNKGGTPLDTFDIVVAKYAEVGEEQTLYEKLEAKVFDEFDIPSSVSDSGTPILFSCQPFSIIKNERLIKPVKELFLNFLSLICKINETGKISEIDISLIKKEKILKLEREQIEGALPQAYNALVRSMAFLQFRCGIHSINYLSYNLMLLPIGIALMYDEHWNNRFAINKIEYWYWSSLFSGRFREKQNQRSISETKDLLEWIKNNSITPDLKDRMDNVFTETNYSDFETLMLQNEDKSVPTAIHNGILQYVLSGKPNDFVETTAPLKAWEIAKNGVVLNDHHIIPLGSAKTLGESARELRGDKSNILNSPLNRTFISLKANNDINDLSPATYLPVLNKAVNYSHLIGSDTFDNLNMDVEAQKEFLGKRFKAISNAVSRELTDLRG